MHPSVDAGAGDNGLGITKLHQKNRNANKLTAFAYLLAQEGQIPSALQPVAMKTIWAKLPLRSFVEAVQSAP